MDNQELLLSDKFKAFMKHDAPVEFLEGTTAAGKTTVGIVKFLFKVAESEKKQHIISGLDLGTVEKNIVNQDLGIIDIFGEDLIEYNGNGKGNERLAHLEYHTPNGTKTVYIFGYDNKKRWQKALGGQYGCLYIDEINIADMDFIREASMRCDYLMGTLNPDDPNLPVYKEYINCSRPLEEWEEDTPKEILDMLTEEAKKGWVHWFFDFDDNAGLSEEKKEKIIQNVPKGTKLYKNKIQGLRGRATGLVFSNFSRKHNVITEKQAKQMDFKLFTAGVDTAYSKQSEDTIAFLFQGITEDNKLVTLDEEVYNNRDLDNPIAPSDTVRNLISFMNRNKDKWGLARDIFIDSADQATITECQKYKNQYGSIYNFINAYKKTKIIDRIHLQIGWLNHSEVQEASYLILDTCTEHIRELEVYSWLDDKYEPEDNNDHTINASQYGWLPFKHMIGGA